MNEIEFDAIAMYEAASDKGRKEAKKARQSGRPIHPTAFETLCTSDVHDTVRSLGVTDISIENIVGPLTITRANAFSPGFLPVLDAHTEFAVKWIQVCAHQMKDGISDPVKVIEYMGLYYVEEGNKRISVMKWLGGESIRADVTRRISAFDPSDATSRLYHAMLSFEAQTRVREVRLSKESSYDRLITHLQERPRTSGSSQTKTTLTGEPFALNFRAPFLRLLRRLAGEKLLVLPDDALLAYLDAFPQWTSSFDESLVEQRIKKLLPDWCTPSASDDIQRPPAPLQELYAKRWRFKQERDLIGIIHLEDKQGSLWTASHQAGLAQAREYLPPGTLREITLPADTHSLDSALQSTELVDVRTIVCSAPTLYDQVLKSALGFEDRQFHLCSPLPSSNRVATYFGCPHEPLFLMGILAATRTATGRIGWLGDITVQHSAASLNAFMLGVRTLRPDALVYPIDSTADSIETWTRFAGNDIDLVLTSPVDALSGSNPADLRPFALLCPDKDAPCTAAESLASVVWDWGTFYEGFLPFLLREGTRFIGRHHNKRRMPTWRGGLANGLPDLQWQENLFPSETARLVTHLRQAIQTETFQPFVGPLKDKEGTLRVIAGKILSTQEILDMDWLVDGIMQ